MAVVDVYGALVQRRVYRDAMTHEQASAIISEGRGSAFDPDVVDAFARCEEDFRRIAERDARNGSPGGGSVSEPG